MQYQRPYLIKNHLPVGFLPKTIWTTDSKIIYIARNPKDVALSFYHHYKNYFKYDGTLDEFYGLFLDDLVEFGPWVEHVKEFWKLRTHKNMLFLTYEEMKKNLPDCIQKTANFLGKQVTEEQIQQSVHYLQFDSMKERDSQQFAEAFYKAVGGNQDVIKKKAEQFFRKGEVGAYKKEMPEEFVKRFDELVRQKFGDDGPY